MIYRLNNNRYLLNHFQFINYWLPDAVWCICSIHGIRAFCWTLVSFQFIFTQSVGLLEGDQTAARPLPAHTGQHKERINAHRQRCLKFYSNPRSRCSAGEGISCLRQRGHCDQRSRITIKPWSRLLRENPFLSQLVKRFPTFHETRILLSCSQEPATCPYPERLHGVVLH
jgi:hypothetical protein